jgi:tRNA/tmRNA/rRNA uracil-C5-methylase (TrmA/RlmC/RlmD family)
VKARVVHRARDYAVACLEEILEPSSHRIEPACPLAGICPGCAYQHVDYPEEVSIKWRQLKGMLGRRNLVSESAFLPPVGSPVSLGYRNKIVLHGSQGTAGPVLGYVGEDNQTVLDVPRCLLAAGPIDRRLCELRATPSFMRQVATRRKFTLRHTEKDGVVQFFGEASADFPWLTESTRVGDLTVPPGSFFQVNSAVADALLEGVMDRLKVLAMPYAVDLYGGSGVFARVARQAGVQRVIGVDADEMAIRAATRNVEGAEFIARGAATGLRRALRQMDPPSTVVIMDPPRTGLDRRVVEGLLSFRPLHLLYISCAADTLARDLGLLTGGGYVAQTVRLYDMFPRTPYFETLTWLMLKRAPAAPGDRP